MKYLKILAGFIAFFGIFSLITNAQAMTVIKPDRSTGNVKIESGEIISDNVVTAGNDITIRGEINDNVIVFGRVVKISGKINGSLFVAAQELQIEGEITKDVFVGAASVLITENGKIDRDLACGSANLIIDGQIGRNVMAGTGTLSIDGKIGGNVTASSSLIEISGNADIFGSLSYYSQKELSINNPDKIAGGVNFNKIQKANNDNIFSGKFSMWILGLIMSVVLGFLLIAFFPKRTKKIAECINENWSKSLGIGFLMFVVMPLIAFIFMILIIGLPVGLILFVVYLILIYIAKIWVSLYLGNMISHKKWNPYWAMILGLVILYLIYLIPIAGPIIAFIVILIGLGGLYLSKPLEGEK